MIWKCKDLEFDLGQKVLLMGIVNVTPDSFSDGGAYDTPTTAISHAVSLAEQGADIIDIGGESTRPGAKPVSPQEEIRRVIPVIQGIRNRTDAPISIDTRNYEVAYEALQSGAQIINDVSALRHSPRMGELASETGAGVVMMHMRGTPQTMQTLTKYEDIIGDILKELNEALESAVAISGLERERVVFDPGIGFAKTPEQNMEIFKRLRELHKIGRPILLGFSRKSMLKKICFGETPPTDSDRRIIGANAAATAMAVMRGANILRVHDVAEMAHAIKVTQALR